MNGVGAGGRGARSGAAMRARVPRSLWFRRHYAGPDPSAQPAGSSLAAPGRSGSAWPLACRRRAPRSAPRRTGGFTLIEVLLATVLLAAGLALAFASLRAATGTTQRGEAIARHSERVRAVEGFLRRRISGARPIPFGSDPDSGQQLRFLGDGGRMRFVADVPDYLGRGGPYLHELVVDDAGDGVRLSVALTMVQAGMLLPERPPRAPEVLADGLRDVRFRYRALDPENRLGQWQDSWEDAERLPLQVQVLLRDADGRDWPPLVVALPLANSFAAMAGGGP